LIFVSFSFKTIVIVGNHRTNGHKPKATCISNLQARSHIFFILCITFTSSTIPQKFCPQFKNYIKILLFVSELRHKKDQPLPISHHVFYLSTSR